MTLLMLRLGFAPDEIAKAQERHAITLVILGLWLGVSREKTDGKLALHFATEWPSWCYWSSRWGRIA